MAPDKTTDGAIALGFLQKCFSGDAIPFPAGCSAADLDGDNDTDAADFSTMLPCLRGADVSPGC